MSLRPPIRLNVPVPGADGASLATDVFLPADRPPTAVVVTRTPYGKSAQLAEGMGWSRHGFAFVVQDVRGRYESEGQWVPYRGERADGQALIEWVSGQPWCDGKIIPYGSSYAAYTAWAMAIEAPDYVRGLISMVPAMGLRRVKFDSSGVLRLYEHVAWWLEHADGRTDRPGLAAAALSDPNALTHLPVVEIAEQLCTGLPNWAAVVTAGPEANAPEEISDDELAGVVIPVLHVGGWYDLLINETLHQWSVTGSAHKPRPCQSLLIGPWSHNLTGTAVGAREHAPHSQLALGKIHVDWIKKILDEPHAEAQAQVFIVGSNTWWSGPEWPPQQIRDCALYAAPGGSLDELPSLLESEHIFRYDPVEPLPSVEIGFDSAPIDDRPDLVRFTSRPLPSPLTIIGAQIELHARTDAADTDWVVQLLERYADGTVITIARGACQTDGQDRFHIELSPMAVSVPAGNQLELRVSSSDFPYLARNLCTGKDRYTTEETVAARQRVLSGPDHPTRILLRTLEGMWLPKISW